MNAKEFFNTVKAMRKKQKEYFATRTTSALRESKELEHRIDDEIKRVEKIMEEKQNPKLL